MIIRKFDCQTDVEMWNAFVAGAKNSTFLFNRSFMDYHSDRLTDYSLIISDEKGKIISIFPANITEGMEVFSHQGLTYGGLLFNPDVKLLQVLEVLSTLLNYLHNQGVEQLYIKHFPSFYNSSNTEELEYAYFLTDAILYRRDVAFVVDQEGRIPYTGNIRREGTKAFKQGAVVKVDDDLERFWTEVLQPGLAQKHGVKPVHSLNEIIDLKLKFPDNIVQVNAYLGDELVAGTTLFLTPTVVHCQYISSTDIGRKSGCLNHLFKHLVDDVYSSYRFFDFGIVNENSGRDLNTGMLFWKEGFGGRAHKQDFYKVSTRSYTKLAHYFN